MCLLATNYNYKFIKQYQFKKCIYYIILLVVVDMDLRDIGLVALILTWIDTIAYTVYLDIFKALPFATLENFLEVGRDPALFLTNLILYHISIFILLRNKDKETEIIKRIFWAYPITNIVVAVIYALLIAGPQGMIFVYKAPFIVMYSFITQLTVFLVDIRMLPIKYTQYIRESMLIFVLVAELFIYIIIRIILGSSPILASSFLILALLTITVYIIKIMK